MTTREEKLYLDVPFPEGRAQVSAELFLGGEIAALAE